MLTKSEQIKATRKQTKDRRKSQTLVVRELKLNNPDKATIEKLIKLFLSAKWLTNYILTQDPFDITTAGLKEVPGLDKDHNVVTKDISNLPAKLKASVLYGIQRDIKALSARKKNGHKIGKLKFRTEVNSISLSQYGNTHEIRNNCLKLVGFKQLLKLRGIKQLKDVVEFANAKLIRKAGGFYIHLTCLLEKQTKQHNNCSVGLDFGIKTAITTSDADQYNISIGESERLKQLQRRLFKQKKGSNNRYKTRMAIRREYNNITNKKNNQAKQIIAKLSIYESIYMQDEAIKGWHKGLFGKQVQNSCLGMLKAKLIKLPQTKVIKRYVKTTKVCSNCLSELEGITLATRVITCTCGYIEDRDVNAAKVIKYYGDNNIHIKVGVEHAEPEVVNTSNDYGENTSTNTSKECNNFEEVLASELSEVVRETIESLAQ